MNCKSSKLAVFLRKFIFRERERREREKRGREEREQRERKEREEREKREKRKRREERREKDRYTLPFHLPLLLLIPSSTPTL